MFLATAASLYSSSPPTIPTTNATSHCAPCSSSPIDIEFHARTHPHHHHHASRPVIGGLSSLFSSPSVRFSPCSISDALGIDGSPLSRRSSHTDLCALLESGESRPESSAPAKMRERSPVTSFQGPPSFGSPQLSSNKFCSEGRGVTSSSMRVITSPFEQEEVLTLDDTLDLDYAQYGSPPSFMSEMDISGLEVRPDTPRFTKVACLSLSEFFCKPLFAEAFRTSQDILRIAQRQHEIFSDPFVIKAFEEAERAHYGQFRANGDLYLVHCVETAMILAAIGANKTVVAAGLLHDTMDDTSLHFTQLQELFGFEVANLVGGVGKLSEFSKLARDNNTAYKSVEADRLHTMMLAMADIRVVLIKLADRLHNMRTLGALAKEKQSRIAKETLEVFAPLAGRLGIWSWKAELEDLCFKHLKHHDYQELFTKLSEGFRERTIMSAIRTLDECLSSKGVQYLDLCGRPKNLYSIHKKMLLKGRKADDIYDVHGLRLIVSNVEDCYSALEEVHSTWQCVPGKLKDYISQPKMNGYQSLHTVVWGEDGLPLEIQIRTMEMHYQAEFGVAAHWRYKEGNAPHSSFVLQMVEWARWVLTWQNEILDTKLRLSRMEDVKPICPFPFHREGCPYSDLSMGPPLHEDAPLFVIVLEDDKMMVQELPGSSTVADLLERTTKEDALVATVGGFWEEARPKVNHKNVEDIQQELKMGDLVELQPSVPGKSLNEYREKLRRMFEDCSMEGLKREPKLSRVRLSETVVF
ncbi:hypothetical protein GOP47_0001584 [Adiantum capillus-veneris]|uniref:GTP diphosphokinase n=1 Tax=Adiantum capillus-veneris TaxID=13818 RepID=A0A9D4V8I9_ADICA|nr:hypothetical protein GOP47_0001584 [Adiantum capillus-veneris]